MDWLMFIVGFIVTFPLLALLILIVGGFVADGWRVLLGGKPTWYFFLDDWGKYKYQLIAGAKKNLCYARIAELEDEALGRVYTSADTGEELATPISREEYRQADMERYSFSLKRKPPVPPFRSFHDKYLVCRTVKCNKHGRTWKKVPYVYYDAS